MELRPVSSVVRALTGWGWCLIALGLLTLPGCSGCSWWGASGPTTVEEEDKTKPKPKADFELAGGTVLPYNLVTLQTGYKPGHWTTAAVDGVANNFDANLAAIVSDPIEALDMPYSLSASQTISLPKGQKRRRELTFYVPPRYDDLSTNNSNLPRRQVPMLLRLQPPDGWRTLTTDLLRVRPLENYQYYFMVLAQNVEPHQYWDKLPAMLSHADFGDSEELDKTRMYFVLVPPVVRTVPVPSTSLTWTAIAYVVWDGLSPDLMTEAQQKSMIDWLHWGGQLIVSGPDSLAALEKSRLAPFLPATSPATREYTAEELADFRREWWPNRELPPIKDRWSGVALEKHAEAVTLVEAGDAPLVVERAVGQGRIVVTGFRLTEPEYIASIGRDDSFVNGVLMRRPSRAYYRRNESLELAFNWSNTEGWPSTSLLSPALASRVGFFSRDAESRRSLPDWAAEVGDQFREKNLDENERLMVRQYSYPGERELSQREGPRAAWDDFNGVSTEARTMLVQASGIKVPDRSFVVLVMGVYLIILVPLNWMVFRAIGRVEWAWAAAPVITICYALAVVKLAEVNVGFSRPRNDVAVIEVQKGYQRAHLTRYTSLYASLFTSYNLKFDDSSAVVAPLADGRRLPSWQARPTLTYKRDGDAVTMDDFEVASNSLSMLHSEQMFDLGGTIDLDLISTNDDAPVYQVTNNSRRVLKDVQVYGPARPTGASTINLTIDTPLVSAPGEGIGQGGLNQPASDQGIYFDLGTLEPGQSKVLDPAQARDQLEFKTIATETPPTGDAAAQRTPGARRRGQSRAQSQGSGPEAPAEAAGTANFEPATGDADVQEGPSGFNRAKLNNLWRVARETRPKQEWRLVAWSDEVLPGMEAEPAPQIHREANLFVVHLADQPIPQASPDTTPRSTIPMQEEIDLTAPLEGDDPNAVFDANFPPGAPAPQPAAPAAP